MKNIRLYSLFFILLLFTACEIDDFAGPNAQFYGSIIDQQTGSLVEQDLENGMVIQAYELGFENPVAQSWLIKNSGEFLNNLVFANRYDLFLRNGNCYPIEVKNHVIKKGKNRYDFQVIPYLRIQNCRIQKDDSFITATFSLEGGKDEVKAKRIQLFAFSDQYVGNPIKFTIKGGGDSRDINENPAGNTYELKIDLSNADNKKLFKSGKNYYFRVGALADVGGVGTIRYNYAPCVAIPF